MDWIKSVVGPLLGIGVIVIFFVALVLAFSALSWVVNGMRRVADGARNRMNDAEIAGRPSLWKRLVIGPSGLRGLAFGPIGVSASLVCAIRYGKDIGVYERAFESAIALSAALFGVLLFLWVCVSSMRARKSTLHACATFLPRSAGAYDGANRALTRRALAFGVASAAIVAVPVYQAVYGGLRAIASDAPARTVADLRQDQVDEVEVLAPASGTLQGALSCVFPSAGLAFRTPRGGTRETVTMRAHECDAELRVGFFRADGFALGVHDYRSIETRDGPAVSVAVQGSIYMAYDVTLRVTERTPDRRHGKLTAKLRGRDGDCVLDLDF